MALRSSVLNRSLFFGRVSAQSTMNKHHSKQCHFHSVPIPHLGSATPPRLGPLGPLGARAQHGHLWYIPGSRRFRGFRCFWYHSRTSTEASTCSGDSSEASQIWQCVFWWVLPWEFRTFVYVEHQVQETTPNSFLSLPIGTDLFLLLPKQLHNILNRLVVNIECQGPF